MGGQHPIFTLEIGGSLGYFNQSAIRALYDTFILPSQEIQFIQDYSFLLLYTILDFAAAGTRINPSAPSSPLPTPIVHIISYLLFLAPTLLLFMYLAHFVLPCQAHHTGMC